MFKLKSIPAILAGLLVGASLSVPAKAVMVTEDYTLTFTGSNGSGTGLLVINETSPIASFSENSAGDLVSLQATIGGLTYNFVPASVVVDLGTNQIFYSISGSSSSGSGEPQPPGLNRNPGSGRVWL